MADRSVCRAIRRRSGGQSVKKLLCLRIRWHRHRVFDSGLSPVGFGDADAHAQSNEISEHDTGAPDERTALCPAGGGAPIS